MDSGSLKLFIPMRLIVQSRFFKFLTKFFCLFCVLTYVVIAVRDSVAYQFASSEQRHFLERAVALDPTDAEYRNRLGYYFMFSERRPDFAVPMYESAVSLNPHIAEYWLDLATAYSAIGARRQQELALARAIEVEPRTPLISREVAIAFFSLGDLQQAFRLFRVVLQTDPWETEPMLTMCWQATHNLDAMNEVLPPVPSVHLAFLRLLVAEENTEAAKKLWSRLIALSQPFDPELAAPYLDYLITQRQTAAARAAWNELARINADFRPYQSSPANLVVNGGFEQKLLNMGFDWRYENHPHVTLAWDSEQSHNGSRSLSITFDGEAILDTGVSQLIAVNANTRYSLRAYVKSDSLFAAHGPQCIISDPDTKNSLLVTEETLGSSPWTQISGSFTTSPTTDLVSLKIMRAPGAGRITGKFWIDDVILVTEQ